MLIDAIWPRRSPADDERRTFTVLGTAYSALSLTDLALAIGLGWSGTRVV